MKELHAAILFTVFHLPVYKTNILPFIQYGCEICRLSSKEYGLMVLEGKELRRIFDLRGRKQQKATENSIMSFVM